MECTPTPTSTLATVPSIPSFDLETYISRYDKESETRLQRLLFIADKSPSEEISKLAFELAERQMKSVGNSRRYSEIFGVPVSSSEDYLTSPSQPTPFSQRARQYITYDDQWYTDTEKTAHSQRETLEARLASAQSHLAKEAIRSAFLSLSDFYKRRGDLRESMRCLLRSREFCTTNKQIALVCLEVIEVGIDSGNYAHVNAYITKAEHTSDLLSSGPPLTSAKLQCASGLLFLHEGRYTAAAHKLAAVSFDLQFNRVISAEDIAMYASLLGLASLKRDMLQKLILDSQTFQQRLELVPYMRDALRYFSRAEYQLCLDVLNQLKPELRLDIHLSSHIDVLYQKILDRCIITYFFPYKSVSLSKMGRTFNMSRNKMEDVIEKLILEGRIKGARISESEGILTMNDGNQGVMKRVLKCGEEFISETESMILRMSCLEQDLIVQGENARSFGIGRFARQRADAFEGYSSDEEVEGTGEDIVMMDVEVLPEMNT